jgi:hypothetical protein
VRRTATEQTVSWFYQRFRGGTLRLSPPFQRRPVWTRRQQSNMIESILLDLPIPEIFLQQIDLPTGNTEFVVVDGQQRIRALLEFIGNEEEPGFELLYLEPNSEYQHRSFSDLTDDEKTRFFGYVLAVRTLREATENDLRNLFQRINRYLTKLTSQELRNATYSGPFPRLVEELADDDFWSAQQIVGPQSIRRMGDIEFVSDLMFGIINGPQGGDPNTLDRYWAAYDEYETEIPNQAQIRRTFGRTRDTLERIVPDLRASRWHNKSDFYSLFVALAALLEGRLPTDAQATALSTALAEFTDEIELRVADDAAATSPQSQEYLAAVQRGSTEKSRRVDRHEALLSILHPALNG